MPKIKIEDVKHLLTPNMHMWKHEDFARFIAEKTDGLVKVDPTVIALIAALKAEWRASEQYTNLVREHRVQSEVARKATGAKRGRPVKDAVETVEEVEEVEAEAPKPKAKKKIKTTKTEEEKPAKVKTKKAKPEVTEEVAPKTSKKSKGKKKVKPTAVAEETVFDS